MNTFSVDYISHNNHYPYYYILFNYFSCRCPVLFKNLGKDNLTRNSLPTDAVLSKLTHAQTSVYPESIKVDTDLMGLQHKIMDEKSFIR